MRKPTIYKIKQAVKAQSPYFFSRNSMRAEGQTLKDFHVDKTDDPGKYIIRARSAGYDGKFNGLTKWFFTWTKYPTIGKLTPYK